MSFDIDPDALASALPAAFSYTTSYGLGVSRQDVAEFQAERLAEAGYRLVHDECADGGRHATVDSECIVCGADVALPQTFAEHTADALALVTDPPEEPGLKLVERGTE